MARQGAEAQHEPLARYGLAVARQASLRFDEPEVRPLADGELLDVHDLLLAGLQSHENYIMSAATPQEGILILLKISIALRFEPYRRSGKLGLYHVW